MSRASFALHLLLLAGSVFFAANSSFAEDKTAKSGQNDNVVKIGVAVLKNTSTRSVPLTFERDRLVNDINHVKKRKHSKTNAKIEAVPLDSSSFEEASAQARQLGCDYIVFTNLTELRESGDAAPAPHPGEIRLGRDPVADNPNVGERHEVQRYAVLDFQLYGAGETHPRVDSSVSDHQPTTEDGIVSMLLDRVASRVVSEIRTANPQPPME
jgi:hypothetical protein